MTKKWLDEAWEDVPEAEPDEWDLRMLEAIENGPECHAFTPAEDIDWDAPVEDTAGGEGLVRQPAYTEKQPPFPGAANRKECE